ncbi:hypothetical protein SAMN05444398_107164 [Roseovarius pacificus]|uniref:Membrane protein YjdF n=1 Tax=Roseovarius pacificus TaxID=337701 RepID=A0A1M7EQA0_9RHOB|nr:hypothetical protein [Roseovarius pacificus]GGO57595.1 hypothetical protein GCM10011315_25130 [Roseovarius pacificus]SHL93860.1 hypothetical protein SAMN05444398_107164 [Roseovarius pacificus]
MFSEQTWLARIIWGALLVVALWALVEWQLELAFVALATLALSVAPLFVARWADIRVPPSFIAALVIFVAGTLFLGEVFDFYERLWWWDMAMHASSAVGFGLIGFVLMFIMFQGDRFAAPPIAVAFFAFCFAMTIGVLWEIFEFGMDQTFGMNMQKSGLMDTMGDLIVDMIGAMIGAASGFAYLKGQARGGVQQLIDEFVERNPRFFKRWKK